MIMDIKFVTVTDQHKEIPRADNDHAGAKVALLIDKNQEVW